MKNLAFIFVLILTVANIGLAQGKTNEAEMLYELGMDSKNEAILTADVDKNIGDLEKALEHFTDALKIEPRKAKILLARGETYLELHEFEKALADCRKALQIAISAKRKSPTEIAAVYFLLGKIYRRGFYFSKAIENYTTAIKFDPKNFNIYQDRGFVYYYIREVAKGKADFAKSSNLIASAENTGGVFTIGGGSNSSLTTTKPKELKPDNDNSKIEYPEDFQIIYFPDVGDGFDNLRFINSATLTMELQQKYFEREIEKAKKIIKFNPKSEYALWKLADWNLRADKFQDAGELFVVLFIINFRYQYINNSGVMIAKIGNLKSAAFQFGDAIKKDKTKVEAFYNRGLCFLKLNDNEKAIADFTEVIKLNPKFVLAYQSRAKAYLKLGKTAEAEADEQMIETLKKER